MRDFIIKHNNLIDNTEEEYSFLGLDYPIDITVLGDTYHSIRDAYQSIKKHSHDTRAMSRVLYNRFYQHTEDLEKLLTLKSSWIAIKTTDHNNFWFVCNCKECLGDSQNYYGRLLMEVRDRFVWEKKFLLSSQTLRHTRNWRLHYVDEGDFCI